MYVGGSSAVGRNDASPNGQIVGSNFVCDELTAKCQVISKVVENLVSGAVRMESGFVRV